MRPEIISAIGIIANIAGVLLVFIYSPINNSILDGGMPSSPSRDELRALDARNNKYMKLGVYVVVFGNVLQLIAAVMPLCKSKNGAASNHDAITSSAAISQVPEDVP